MKRRRWVFGAVAVAGAFALVAPATGQGKANAALLGWSPSNAAVAIISYSFGVVDIRPPVGKAFRLWDASPARSGPLRIKLTGSSAFRLGTDTCAGAAIGKKTSCWVGVLYKPSRAGASDSATLTATGKQGAVASLTVSGGSAAPSPGHVYWVGEGSVSASNGGTVNAASRGGGAVSTLASGLSGPRAVAVDGTRVYWADASQGTVGEVPLGGGSVTVLATGRPQLGPLTVDGTNVYWVDYQAGTVNEVPVGGGTVTTLATGQSAPLSITTDGTNVYWGTSNGKVQEVPVGGGTVTTLATGQGANSLAVDGTDVYWANDGAPSFYYPAGGTVNKVPIGGGTVTTLASGQVNLSSVAVDGTNVYWATWGTSPSFHGTVREVPLGGGSVTTLASHQTFPRSLAVDGTHVYWIDGAEGDDTLRKLRLGSSSVAILASGLNLQAVAVGP